MYCKDCGILTKDEAKYCSICKKRIDDKLIEDFDKEFAKNIKTVKKCCGCLAVIVGVVLLVIVVIWQVDADRTIVVPERDITILRGW